MTLPEDRSLKIGGLAGMSVAVAIFVWLGTHVTEAVAAPGAAARFLALSLVAVNVTALALLLLSAGCGMRTSWRNPRRRHAILLQLLLANVLTPAVVFTVLVSDKTIETDFDARGWSVPFSVVSTAAILVAWRLWRRAQKYEAPDADEAMRSDPRPPVLYLRSFKDDGDATIGRQSRLTLRILGLISVRTPEQELADILDHLGPVVAIGKPGEPLPELGAARLYVSHDEWQGKVMALMQQAALIVIRVGGSAGVLWEIERALTLIPRERLAIVLIGSAAPAPELARRLAPVLGAELSAFMPDTTETWAQRLWRDPRRRIGSVVCFPGGVPRAVPLTMWPPWGRDLTATFSFRPSALPLRRGWRTVFTLLNRDAGLMLDRPSRGIAIVLALVFGWTGVHWLYLGHRRRALTYLLMLVIVPMFLAFYDALRFVLADRTEFEARWVAPPPAAQR